jgi:hypothetical protein
MHWFLAVYYFILALLHVKRMQWLIQLCVILCYVAVMWMPGMHRSIWSFVMWRPGMHRSIWSFVMWRPGMHQSVWWSSCFYKICQAWLSSVKISSVKMILYLRALLKFCACFLLCLIWVQFGVGFFNKNWVAVNFTKISAVKAVVYWGHKINLYPYFANSLSGFGEILHERFSRTAIEVVKALRYKLEGRGIDSRWCQNFSLT